MAHTPGQAAHVQRQTPWLSGGPASVVFVAMLAVVLVITLPSTAESAWSPDDDFQVPFACGESWEGDTRPSHRPSSLAVDWDRDTNDRGHLVIASSPGVVESVKDLGNSSYGLYVVLDHRGGWTTLHAHLLRSFVVPGQRVDQGQVIGRLGNSGGSSFPHLHYEQRRNGSDRHVRFDGSHFDYNTWIKSRNCADVPVVGDWNGDRASDVGTFTRRRTGSVFRKRLPRGARQVVAWGRTTDQPLVGDWDGDGRFELGVWRQATQRFILRTPPKPRRIRFGDSKDTAIAGDWDGDNRWDVGTFDPRSATFSLRLRGGAVRTKTFGSRSILPVTGDWDGDGRWGVGTFNPVTSTFRLNLGAGVVKTINFGRRASLPVVGNWKPDGISRVGVWDTATGVFSQRLSPTRTRKIRFGHAR